MDNASINKVNKHVYRQFPELNGKSPNVQSYAGSKYLLLYKGSSKTVDGKTINRTIRVVADEKGKILKLTTSR